MCSSLSRPTFPWIAWAGSRTPTRRTFRAGLPRPWRLRAAGLALVVALAAGLPGQSATAAVGLTAHRAVYDLGLGELRGDSRVVRAWGRLEFEWADVCDGWAVSQRTHLAISSEDGGEIESIWSVKSWESKDGLRYRFYIRRYFPNGYSEVTAGSARLDGPGLGGEAIYSDPEERRVQLPAGTLFPTMHSLELMALAEAGRFPVWRVLFDGFDVEDLVGVNATLVQAVPPGQAAAIESELLAGQPSWRMRLAFFPLNLRTPEPDREQGFRIFANGVVDELTLDYGDFTIDGTLEDLSALPDPGC